MFLVLHDISIWKRVCIQIQTNIRSLTALSFTKPSAEPGGSFLQDDQNKGPQLYVLTRTTHTPNILTNSEQFYLKPSQQGSFLQDDQNKG